MNTRLWLLLCMIVTVSCRTTSGDNTLFDIEAGDGLVDPSSVAICSDARITSVNESIHNYGVVKIESGSLPNGTLQIFNQPSDADASLDLLAQQFSGNNCDPAKVKQEMLNGANGTPRNIYLYYAGYGDPVQPNDFSGDHYLLKWINERDPHALILAIGWNCPAAEQIGSGFDFCRKRGDAMNDETENRELFKLLSQTTGDMFSFGQAQVAADEIEKAQTRQNGYNISVGYAVHVSVKLIDHILKASEKANIGQIHAIGYSGGAHMVADLLRENLPTDGSLPPDGNTGVAWTSKNVCENGNNTCTVAQLSKFEWSLALGLAGWSHALRTYNEFSASDEPSPAAQERRALYNNGGFIVPPHQDYNGKLHVVNRRMEPTGTPDDQLQRAFNDILLADYNHTSHDYSQPLFNYKLFVQALDAWLDAPQPNTIPEMGILFDTAADVTFDDCDGATCRPTTNYRAHAKNSSHRGDIIFPAVSTVAIVDGIDTPGSAKSHAVDLRDQTREPLVLRTFDQEDLRGGVEFWYRPQSDLSGTHSLFSYAQCGGSAQELKPRAYISNGELVFENFYTDKPFSKIKAYTAKVDISKGSLAPAFAQGQWVHLAFAWELPVKPIKETADLNEIANMRENANLHAQRRQGRPATPMEPDFETTNALTAFSVGLGNAQPTSFLYQKGQGSLRIFVNGELAAEVPFGSDESARECLFAPKVVSNEFYQRGFDPYIPYRNYERNTIRAGFNQDIQGQLCKAYRVLNEQVFFGCGLSAEVSAAGDMDNVRLIFGNGTRDFSDISPDGTLRAWDVGLPYTSQRRQSP